MAVQLIEFIIEWLVLVAFVVAAALVITAAWLPRLIWPVALSGALELTSAFGHAARLPR